MTLGSSSTNEKCFQEPNNKIFCDTLVGDPEHRLNDNINQAFYFNIWHTHSNKICVRRTDNVHHGWGFQLKVMCKEFPYALRGAPVTWTFEITTELYKQVSLGSRVQVLGVFKEGDR